MAVKTAKKTVKKKTTKKKPAKPARTVEPDKAESQTDGPPIPMQDEADPAQDSEQELETPLDQPADPELVEDALTPEEDELPPSAKDLPIEFHSVEIPLCGNVEFAKTQTIIPKGGDRGRNGVNSQSWLNGHLSSKQQLGLYRLRSALQRQEQLVGNVHGKGKKTIDDGISAVRWLLEKFADVEESL